MNGDTSQEQQTPASVLICLFDGVQSLDVTGPLEVFTGVNHLLAAEHRTVGYEVRTASVGGGPVRTSSGLRVSPDTDLSGVDVPHTLVVPGGNGALSPDPDLVDWVRAGAAQASRVMSVCTGVLVLAETGLLDGRRVATHWAAAGEVARRFPAVEVDPEPLFMRDGKFVTSAGVTAGIDLALALVEEDLGRGVALAVARHLVTFLRRPGTQIQFSDQFLGRPADREVIRDVQQWIAESPGVGLSVEALAARAGLSPRQFARTFAAEVGVTPGKYVDRVRLEAARLLLEDTTEKVSKIAQQCGYGTPEAMRRAFLRTVGFGPAEYRRRFTSRGSR